MKFKIPPLICLIFISFINCENEFLAINCKNKILRQYEVIPNRIWKKISYLGACPISEHEVLNTCKTSFAKLSFSGVLHIKPSNTKCKNINCNTLDDNYEIYQCVVISKNPIALDVPNGCVFKHTLNDVDYCFTEPEWKIKASDMCTQENDGNKKQLTQIAGIYQCPLSSVKGITYKAIQYVCCPKLDMYRWYMMHVHDTNRSVKLEKQVFQVAKKALRENFKLRQKHIQDRFIQEEKSIDIWAKYPKMASFIEGKSQKKFKQKFMSEMNREVDLLRELEIIHENRMQSLFEEHRKEAKDRLEYTLQETNPQVNRIADALKLQLESIINEAKDITDFYETLIKEDLDNTKRNKELIRKNFNSLVFQSWDAVIELLDKLPNLKDGVLKTITKHIFKREVTIKRFHYLDNFYLPKNSMKNQAENFVKNIISIYGHDKPIKKLEEYSIENISNISEHRDDNGNSTASRIIMVFLLCLSIILLMAISLLLYRFHGKINSYLSNTFKKIHPPTKSLFVQIENYPFKNRYNYGNGIYQPYFKSEESVIDNSNSVYNQHFSSTSDSSNEGLKKSVQSDYPESPISNINGLENPICRLLDEK